MARGSGNDILRPSFLDRLVEQPDSRGTSAFSGIGVQELKRAVSRDLEWLLNTRIWVPWPLDDLEEAPASILNYGMPDLSIYSWAVPSDALAIADLIERAIRTFEPRLLPHSVKCEVVASDDAADFALRIRIEAVLHVDPITEPVAFDSSVDIEGGGLRIESFE